MKIYFKKKTPGPGLNFSPQPNNMARFKESDLADLKVRMADFERALGEVKPAFGATEEDFNLYGANASVIEYSDDVVVKKETMGREGFS